MSARELQINTLQDQCTELKMQLRATKDERDLLAKQLIDAENNSKLNLKKLKVSEKENQTLKKELEQLKKSLNGASNASDGMQKALTTATAHIEKLTNENKDLHVALVAAGKLKQKVEKEWSDKYNAEVNSHNKTKELLKQAENSTKSNESTNKKKITELEKEIATLKTNSATTIQEMKSKHDLAIKENQQQQEKQHQKAIQLLVQKFEKEKKEQQTQHVSEIKKLRSELSGASTELRATLQKEYESKLKAALAELTIKLNKEKTNALKKIEIEIQKKEKEKTLLRLTEQEKKLKKEARDATMKVTIACQKDTDKKLAALELQHQAAMATLRSEIERKVRKEMSDALALKEKELQNISKELSMQHNDEMNTLRSTHALALEALRLELSNSTKDALLKEKEQWLLLQNQIVLQARKEEQNISAQHLAKYQTQVDQDIETALQTAINDKNQSMETINKKHLIEIESIVQKNQQELILQGNELRSEKSAMEIKLKQEAQDDLLALTQELNTKTITMKKAMEQLQMDEMKHLKETLNATYDQKTQLQKDSHLEEIARLQKEHKNALNILENTLNEKHSNEMNLLTQGHVDATRQLNDEFYSVKTLMEETHATLEMQYKELQYKFKNRESRPEDLDRIAQLEHLMIAKDEEVKK